MPRRAPPVAAVALLLALCLLAPLAQAHLEFQRPVLQAAEARREVNVTLSPAGAARIHLFHANDPLREAVQHDVAPAQGAFQVEHREHLSRADEAVRVRFELSRLVEYRDANADGLLTPEVDAQIRAWRFPALGWRAGPVQNALVGGATSKIVTWNATVSGGPRLNLTVAAVGQEVVDEGARARPQDVLLYLDLAQLPPRGLGNLHALEGQVVAPAGATLASIRAPTNETVGVRVDADGRRAFFLWGGQGTVDGREQPLVATLGLPVEKDGNVTWELRLNFPTMERGAHLVMVTGIEYEVPQNRTPDAAPAALVLSLLGLALLRRRARIRTEAREKP